MSPHFQTPTEIIAPGYFQKEKKKKEMDFPIPKDWHIFGWTPSARK